MMSITCCLALVALLMSPHASSGFTRPSASLTFSRLSTCKTTPTSPSWTLNMAEEGEESPPSPPQPSQVTQEAEGAELERIQQASTQNYARELQATMLRDNQGGELGQPASKTEMAFLVFAQAFVYLGLLVAVFLIWTNRDNFMADLALVGTEQLNPPPVCDDQGICSCSGGICSNQEKDLESLRVIMEGLTKGGGGKPAPLKVLDQILDHF